MKLRVETYSGYKSDEHPLRFLLGERWLAVDEVVDRWYAPGASWFRVRAEDGCFYILRHGEPGGAWTLEAYRRHPA